MDKETAIAIRELCTSHGCEIIANPRAIRFDFEEEQPVLTTELEQTIERLWAEQVRAHKTKNGRELLNNQFLYVKDHRVVGEKDLYLEFGITDWKHYSLVKTIPEAPILWTIGTTGVITFNEAGKRYYVFATRNANSSNIGGRLEALPGGYLEPRLIRLALQDPLSDPFKENTRKEFEEEVGLPKDSIISLSYIETMRMGRSHDYSVGYLIDVRTNQKDMSAALESSATGRGEHTQYCIIAESELPIFIRKNLNSLTPRTKSNFLTIANNSLLN